LLPHPGRAKALRYMLDHNPINVAQSFKAAWGGWWVWHRIVTPPWQG